MLPFSLDLPQYDVELDSANYSFTPNVREIKFADGYTQRVAIAGLSEDNFAITVISYRTSDTVALMQMLKAVKENFLYWTPPFSPGKVLKWVISGDINISYVTPEISRISLTLKSWTSIY